MREKGSDLAPAICQVTLSSTVAPAQVPFVTCVASGVELRSSCVIIQSHSLPLSHPNAECVTDETDHSLISLTSEVLAQFFWCLINLRKSQGWVGAQMTF